MSQEPRPKPYTNTLLRLDNEARAMLDEYAAAMGMKLHEAAADMIVSAYAEWVQSRQSPHFGGSLAGKGYGPFGRAS